MVSVVCTMEAWGNGAVSPRSSPLAAGADVCRRRQRAGSPAFLAMPAGPTEEALSPHKPGPSLKQKASGARLF